MASSKLFTYGPSNVDSLLTTTQSVIESMKELLEDAVFNKIVLLKKLQDKFQVEKQGGASILVPLLFGKNSTFKAYSADDVIDTSGQEGLTIAQYKWVNYGGTITLFGDEMRMNAGQGKLIDYIKAKTLQAILSAKDAISIDLFASASNSKKIWNLPSFVDATSNVADINSTTNSWWQSQVTASGSFAARGLADLRSLRDSIIKQGQGGTTLPDVNITTQTILELYEGSLVTSLRYGLGQKGDSSMDVAFAGGSVAFDPNTDSGSWYMLSSDALKFVVHSDANFTVGKFQEAIDQDIRSAKVITMCQLVSGNRRKLGKLTGITA